MNTGTQAPRMGRARGAVLLVMLGLAWISPPRALAQLPSLVVTEVTGLKNPASTNTIIVVDAFEVTS